MHSRYTFGSLWLVALVAVLLIAACGGPAAPDLTYSAEATSTTTVRVTFDRAVGDGAEDALNYVISGGVPVLRAARQSETTILLATGPQRPNAAYELDVRNVRPAASGALSAQSTSFAGGSERAPIVHGAIALSSTEILVTFASPNPGMPVGMDPETALEVAYYDLEVEGGSVTDATPDLAILSAVFADVFRDDHAAVLLTTEPQADARYTLRVSNVTTGGGEKLIDPELNTATFRGIPQADVVAPTLLSAVSLSNTQVLLSFSERILGGDDPSNFAITGPAGELAVTAAESRNAQVLLTTAPQRDELTTYTVSASGITDRQENPTDPDPATATFTGTSRRGPIDGDTVPPRVANVGSIGNATVLVTFSEPVASGTDSAENPQHYRITASLLDGNVSTQATLTVVAAVLRDDRTVVELTTLAQSDLEYVLEVTNVKDLAGNQIAPPERGVDPSSRTFVGTPPGGPAIDSDGDGLSDAAEQKGWIVTIVLPDGSTSSSEVTSDPSLVDTDDDGLEDRDEAIYRTNPRSADSDGDGLSDDEELNIYYSEPTQKDSDGDGLQDGLEVDFFDISPIDADTDGDQLDDGHEVVADNRDPRIADVPRLRIDVGDVALTLDERFTYTDTEGRSQSTTSSTSTTLEQGSSRTFANSDTQTLTSAIEGTVGTEISYSFPKDFGATVSASVTSSSGQEYSSTVSQESSQSSNRAYNESFEKSATFESSSEVVREVVDAAVRLPISLGSLSDVSFTVSNIEITALQQDPLDRSRIIPLATLVPEVAVDGVGSPIYSIGPGGSKSNIVFANREVFPNTVEALLKDPRGLIFEIANYDLTDELGRNFAYVQQDIVDRTASITVDYGDGRLDSFQVATYNGFDGDGRPRGLTMDHVLTNLLGLEYEASVVPDVGSAAVLTRVGNVETDVATSRAWVVFTSASNGDELDSTVDFGDIVLRSGDVYRLSYMQDRDEDRIFAREEYLYGSSDENVNSDGDLLSDFEEIREGWRVAVRGATPYIGYSDARIVDSDQDGILDGEEKERGTDARKRDTDEDGITDYDEVFGFSYLRRGALDDELLDTPYCPGGRESDGSCSVGEEDFVTNPLDPDTDGDGLTDGFELRLGSDPQIDDAAEFVDTDADGLFDVEEAEDCSLVINGSSVDACSSKYEPDTDFDGLPDLLEKRIGSNPQRPDSDGDLLSDYDEFDLSTYSRIDATFDSGAFLRDCDRARTCDYDADGSRSYGSSPLDSDVDGDGLSDYQELVTGWRRGTDNELVFSDPNQYDTDGDGLNDLQERDAQTDPNNRDTDGDASLNGNLSDSEEIAAGLNPLVPDQAVTVTMLRIEFAENGDDDLLGGKGDYFWSFKLRKPDGSEATFSTANDRQIEDNVTLTIGTSFSFPSTSGQSGFEIFGNIYEDDSGDEKCSNSYSQSFTDATAQTISFTNQTGGGCEFTIYFSIGLN